MKYPNRKPYPNEGIVLGIVLPKEGSAGEILLARHINVDHVDPQYELISGEIGKKESSKKALLRELETKTGLVPTDVKFLFRVLSENKKWYYHVFVCVVPNLETYKKDPLYEEGSTLISERSTLKVAMGTPSFMTLQHCVILKAGIKIIEEMCAT